jgi:hypothetical protein
MNFPKKNLLTLTGKEVLTHSSCHRVYDHNDTNLPGGETLIERKLRMPQLQGVKGLAVVVYAESLTTQQMWCHRLSRRANKMESFF